MNADDIARLSRLIDAALEQAPEARAAWLDAQGPEHAALEPALRRALARMDAAPDDSDAADLQPRLRTPAQGTAPPPERIGPWRLLQPLGRGGMGEVWLAERADGAFERKVALKLPHAALLSDALRQRFARERDILAALSHPHIARFLDAGVADGRPYLAMEWIDGLPITAHAEAHALTLPQRLALFGQVLDAVEHAHQRLVAHRDLKPSNILVTAEGEAKLLDFGIAKLLDEDALGASTELTRLGGRALTPDYAAPEQLAGEPVTTAVDIYALGVVLYELLVGRHPFGTGTGTGTARPAGGEAPLASTRVPSDRPDAAARRRALRGDLDAVLAHALEPDPAQRYRSAAVFAAELRHVLRDEPVEARRIGWSMRLAKLVRRHRVESVLGAGLALSLVVGVATIAWAAERARDEAQRAEREAEHARAESRRAESEAARQKATKEFLVSVFKASDPRIASDQPRGAITARQLLDLGARRIDSRFAGDPDTRIELLGIVADIYEELDENKRFDELLASQAEVARAHYGERHPVTLRIALRGVEEAIINGGQTFDEVMASLDRIDKLLHEAGLDNAPERGTWWYLRGMALQTVSNRTLEAERALERAESLYAAVAPNDSRHAFVLSAQANLLHDRGDDKAAANYLRRAVKVEEAAPEPDDAALTVDYRDLGKLIASSGDFQGADSVLAKAVRLAQATYGRNAWPYWIAVASHADALHSGGDRIRAGEMFDALLDLLPPPGHRYRNMLEENGAARAQENVANRLMAEGRPAAARALYDKARVGFAHASTYEYDLRKVNLESGIAESVLGHHARAEALLRSVLSEYLVKAPPANLGRLVAREALARALWNSGQAPAAEHEWREVLAEANDKALLPVALACEGLARVSLRRGEGSVALTWIQRGQQLLDHLTGLHDVRLAPEFATTEAQVLLSVGSVSEAQQVAERAAEALRRFNAPGSAALADAEATLRQIRAATAAR